MANNEALEKQLSHKTILLVDALEDLASLMTLTNVSFEGDSTELKLIFGEGACFITENVVDTAKFLWQLHTLDSAVGHWAVFFYLNHIEI